MKLITLNIEGDNHLPVVIDFLQKQNADVICLQEVFDHDLDTLSKSLDMHYAYAPLTQIPSDNHTNVLNHGIWGICILSKIKPVEINQTYYVGNIKDIPVFEDVEPFSTNRAVLSVKIIQEGIDYTFATTHFTWSPSGMATDLQRDNLIAMVKVLDTLKEFTLTGDFNAPRGREIFAELSKLYKDNIPTAITASLDPNLHRVKNLPYMVDGIFSTDTYQIKNVQVFEGVSDHKAFSAEVEKAK
jgi:endonuclease/exonuclease/phosphatase family metal-dependent hydrolase